MRTVPATIAADKKETKFKDIQSIMKDPLLKAKLNNMVDEAVRCKQRIFNEQQSIKDIRDVARNELNLNPKLFTTYVAAVYNNDYAIRLDGLNQQVDLLELVMQLGLIDDTPSEE